MNCSLFHPYVAMLGNLHLGIPIFSIAPIRSQTTDKEGTWSMLTIPESEFQLER